MRNGFSSEHDELVHCLNREKEEREAAATSSDAAISAAHLGMAERYADRAWSLAEKREGPPIPSDLWDRIPVLIPQTA